LIYEAARLDQPAPTTRQITEALNITTDTVRTSIDKLVARDKITCEMHENKIYRRFFVPELARWTRYSEAGKQFGAQNTTRECITGCGRSFESEGPHHRMCWNCRYTAQATLGIAGTINRGMRRGVSA
jgi:hypothetical protein